MSLNIFPIAVANFIQKRAFRSMNIALSLSSNTTLTSRISASALHRQIRLQGAVEAPAVPAGGIPDGGRPEVLRVHIAASRPASGVGRHLRLQQEVPQRHHQHGAGKDDPTTQGLITCCYIHFGSALFVLATGRVTNRAASSVLRAVFRTRPSLVGTGW